MIRTAFKVETEWNILRKAVALDLSGFSSYMGPTRLIDVARITSHRVSSDEMLTQDNSRLALFESEPIVSRHLGHEADVERYSISCSIPRLPLNSEAAVEIVTQNLITGMKQFETMLIAEGSIGAMEAVQVFMEKAVNETLSNTFGQELLAVHHCVDIDEWLSIEVPTLSEFTTYAIADPLDLEA